MELIKPFGPAIGKFQLTDQIIEDINLSSEIIEKSSELSLSLDWSNNLVGRVTKEHLIPHEVMYKHLEFFGDCIYEYLESQNIKRANTDISISSAWVVRSFLNDFNPVHAHTGCNISSFGYLKIPEWDSELEAERERRKGKSGFRQRAGMTELIYGQAGFLSESIYSISPKVGEYYIFPSQLAHVVYPFRSKGERRSFSININAITRK